MLIGEDQSGQFTARGGSIDFDFFCTLMGKKVKTLSNEDELKEAFRVLDRDGFGYIGAKEMRMICKSLGEDLEVEEVDAMVAEAISNYVRMRLHGRHPHACYCDWAPPLPPPACTAVPAGSHPTPHAERRRLRAQDGKIYFDGFVKTVISRT